MRTQIFADSRGRPWLAVLLLLLLLLLLIGMGWWRGTAVGPQVQVPMFYDAHYLFPRPWILEQVAPGVPDPAPLAFYGANRVSQSFVSEGNRLGLVEVWLAGAEGLPVEVTLAADDGTTYRSRVNLAGGQDGRYYRLQFPIAIQSANQAYRLTLHAPEATADAPAITRTVGGDRLGGGLRLNEFGRPGNLELRTYARGGFPGRWWLAAVGEQLLPDLFHFRLQQYKPEPFKGYVFEGLLLSFAVLSFGFLVLARPPGIRFIRALGWSLVALLAGFLLWQVGSGRLLLPLLARPIPLAAADDPIPIAPAAGEARLVQDLALSLWTAERLPQARLATTEVVDGLPAIRVSADAELHYLLTIPPASRLQVGVTAVGEGAISAAISFGEQLLAETDVTDEPGWLELDLSALAGQSGTLRLVTDTDGRPPRAHSEPPDDAPQVLWLRPQMVTDGDWLLPDPLPQDITHTTTSYHFGEAVELVGYGLDDLEPEQPQPGEIVTVTLYWRIEQPQPLYPIVFVHLLDSEGQIVAQDDRPPVGGAYPLADWQPGLIVADRHELQLPANVALNGARLAVGLYDPATLERWPVVDVDGMLQADGRALLRIER